MPARRSTLAAASTLAALASFLFCGTTQAQTSTTASTGTEPPTLLQQLSRETQHTYENLRGDIVRVQLPTPQWLQQVNEEKRFLEKWGAQLRPEVREQFLREQALIQSELYRRVGVVAPIQPPAPSTQAVVPTSQPAQAGSSGGVQFPSRHASPRQTGSLILVASGMVIDSHGHVIVPFFVDRSTIGDHALPAMTGDGRPTMARFIGSDQLSSLTVLQIELRDDHPPVLSTEPPQDGSLAMVFAPEGGARLAFWNSAHPDSGLIVTPDGSFAGFGLNGRFLEAGALMPIVNQIIATGQFRRAVLGVRVKEVGRDDILRQQMSALGAQPAMYVAEVDPDSAAQRAGVRSGDLILSVAGVSVGDRANFAAIIAAANGNTPLQLLRDNTILTLTADLRAP